MVQPSNLFRARRAATSTKNRSQNFQAGLGGPHERRPRYREHGYRRGSGRSSKPADAFVGVNPTKLKFQHAERINAARRRVAAALRLFILALRYLGAYRILFLLW